MGNSSFGTYFPEERANRLSRLKWLVFLGFALLIAFGVAYAAIPSEADARAASAGGGSASGGGASGGASGGGSNGGGAPPRDVAPPPPLARIDRFAVREDTVRRPPAPGVLRNDRGVGLRAFRASNPKAGRVVLRQNGSLTYTPKKNFSGRASFAYTARDNRNRVSRSTVIFTVNPVNDAPVAVGDSYETNEDETLTVDALGLLDNDTDVEGNSLTVVAGEGPEDGTLSLEDDGSFIYEPDENFSGTDSFTYRANDGKADSRPATVEITVNPVNDAPTTEDGSRTINEDGDPVTIDFGELANDLETGDEDLDYEITSPPSAQGTLSGTGPIRTFTPAEDFNTGDGTNPVEIDFTVTDRGDPDDCGTPGMSCDAPEESNDSTFSVTVAPVNDAPTFDLGDDQTVSEDSTGDTDTPGSRRHTKTGFVTNIEPGPQDEVDANQTVNITTANDNNDLFTQNGQPEVNPSGVLTYTLAENASGEATVTVTATDDGDDTPPNENTSDKTFTITVNAVNDAPTITAPPSIAVTEDVASELTGISIADVDADGGTATLTLSVGSGSLTASDNDGVTVSNSGTSSITLTGSFADINAFIAAENVSFTTASNATSNPTLTVLADDGGNIGTGGAQTDTETVTLAVAAVNDAPEVSVTSPVTVTEDVASPVSGVSVDDADAGDNDITLTLSVPSGTLSATGEAGVDVEGSGTGELILTGSLADINTFIENDEVEFTTALDATANVTLTVTADDGGNTGSGGAQTDAKTVTLEVDPVNDPPTVTFDDPTTNAFEGNEYIYDFTVTDPDSGDSFDVKEADGFPDCGAGGEVVDNSLNVTTTGGNFQCFFADGPANPDVRIQVTDSKNADSNVASRSVDVANVDPVVTAPADQKSDEGENKSFDLGSFTDPGTDGPWEVTVDWGDFSAPDTFPASSPGDLGNREHTYAEDDEYTVTVTVAEAGGTPSDSKTFEVEVANVAPTATANAQPTTINEDDPGELVTLNGGDPGNDPLTFGIMKLPANGKLFKGDGTNQNDEITAASEANPAVLGGDEVTYVPNADYNGPDSFDFEVCDDGTPSLCSEDATVSFDVLAVNDKPDFASQGDQTTNEDPDPRPQTVTNWATFDPGASNESDQSVTDYILTDADGNPLDSSLFTADGQPDVSNNGTLTYTPAENANGSITVKVKVRDGGGVERGGVDTSDARDLTITINSVNDAPSFTAEGNQTVDEDSNGPNDPPNSRQHTVTGWITNFDPGPANESSQQVDDYIVNVTSGGDLFATGGRPDVSNTGTLTYTLAENAFGEATVEVAVRDGGGTDRDGVNTSASQTFTITVNAANDAPALDLDNTTGGNNSTATFNEPESQPGPGVALAPNAAVFDVDDENLDSATVTLTNRPDDPPAGEANESLDANVSVNGVTGITENYDSSTGELSLMGEATKDEYRQVLATVTYNNKKAQPARADRTVTFTVNDGDLDSNVATATVTVVPLNEPPVVDLNGNGDGINSSASFTEGDNPLALAPDAAVTDADDDDLVSAEITLTNPLDENAESLSVDVSGTPSITATAYDSSTGVLSLSGPATKDDYRAALRTVEYANSSNAPDTTAREVAFTVNDGQDDSEVATSAVSVTAVNDAPVNTLPAGPFSTGEGENLVINGFSVEDVDAGGNDIRTNLSVDGGTLALDANAAGGATVSGNETGSVTLDGTVAEVNATLAAGVTYSSATGGSFTLTVTTNDLGNFPAPEETDTDEVAITVDAAPTVTTTDPANNATNVSPSGNITINFSEPVNAATTPNTNSFEVKCPAEEASSRQFTIIDNGTASLKLDPTNDLPGATVCQVRVIASGISDTDNNDPPDNMAADRTFTFETAARAADDTYPQTVTGNVGIDSANIPYSVTANDEIKDATDVTFAGWNGNDGQTENGGTVSMTTSGADRGEFTYNPPAGFKGNDRFTYTLAGGSSATVTVPVSGMVWFVDENATSTGDGRLSNPFDTLGAFQAVNNGGNNPNFPAANDNPAAGENIFLYESSTNYAGPVTLLNNQKLIGQDASQSLAEITGITPPSGSASLPAMNTSAPATTITTTAASTNALNVGSGNTLRGFTVGNKTGSGISGSGFGTLNVSEVGITGSGQALDLSNGTLSGSLSGVTSTSGTNNILLSTVGTNGTFDLGGGALSGASGASFRVVSGSGSFSYSGNVTQNSDASLVNVGSANNGTLTFTGTLTATRGNGLQFSNADGTYNVNGTTTLSNTFGGASADAGIDVATGSSGTFNIATASGGSANITNPSGNAVNVSGSNLTFNYGGSISKTNNSTSPVVVQNNTGGAITFSGSNKTLTSTGTNAAVNLSSNANTAINFTNGGLAATGQNNAPGFSATGGGTVKVSGTGNTISTATGTALNVANTNIGAGASGEGGLNFRSISANGAPNGIALDGTGTSGGLTVTGTGTTAGSGGTIQNTSGADNATSGIGVYLNNTRNVSLSNMQVNDHPNFAVRGNSVVNLTMDRVRVTGTNGNNGSVDEGSVRFDGLTGVASITGSRFEGGFEDNFGIRNTSGTLDRVTFDGNTFGQNVPGNSSNDSLFIQSRGTATLNATLNNNDFDGAGGDVFQFDAGVNSTSDLEVTNNDFINNHPNTAAGGGGVTITTQESGDLTYEVSNNTFRGSKGTALGIAKVFGQPTNATLSGSILNNTIGVSGVTNSGSSEGSGISVSLGGGGSHTNLIRGNQIRQYNNFGIYVFLGGTSQATSGETHNGTMNTTIHANTIAEPRTVGNGVFNGIHLNSGTNSTGGDDAYQVCLDAGSADPALRNTLNGTGTESGTDFRLRQRFATTVRLPGYTGANTDTAAVVSYLLNRNNNPGSTTASAVTQTASGGGGFVNTSPAGSACTQPQQ